MKGYKQFLNMESFNSKHERLRITKVKKTKKGFIIHLMTDYISLIYKYVTLFDNGTAKVVTKVRRNYQAPYQYTVYENAEGLEISLKEFRER